MAQGINDRNVAERDTKKKAFQVDPNSNRIGAMASMGRTDTTQTASVGDNTSAPTSVGELATPSAFGREPPPSSVDELNGRVQRNMSFLSDPQTKAQLMQFGLSLMGSAGRGNPISGFADALSSSAALPGRAAMMNLKYNKEVQGMDIAERSQQVEEARLRIEQVKLIKEGGTPFSRVISGDDPLNEKFGLGLKPGESARVQFISDLNGKIVNASVEAPFGESPKTPEIIQLRNQADIAEKKGDIQTATMLRQQAQTLASGGGGSLLKPGESTVPDPSSPTGFKIIQVPGGEAERVQTEADTAKQTRVDEARMQAEFAIDNIDRATNMIQESIAPNYLVTGWGSLLSYLPNTVAADFSTAIDTIKAHNTVRQLTLMREGSKSGASGLGQVTEFEDRMLSSMLGSLEQKQSAASMLHNLGAVRKVYDAIINTGSLAEIGKKVDGGSMTYDQGIVEAAGALASGGNATQDPRSTGEEPIPFPTETPGIEGAVRDRLKSIWNTLSNEDRKQFLPNPNKF